MRGAWWVRCGVAILILMFTLMSTGGQSFGLASAHGTLAERQFSQRDQLDASYPCNLAVAVDPDTPEINFFQVNFQINKAYDICMVNTNGYECAFQLMYGNFGEAFAKDIWEGKAGENYCGTNSASQPNFVQVWWSDGAGPNSATGPFHFGMPWTQATGPPDKDVSQAYWSVCMFATPGEPSSGTECIEIQSNPPI